MVRLDRVLVSVSDDVAHVVFVVAKNVIDLVDSPLPILLRLEAIFSRHQGNHGRVGCNRRVVNYRVNYFILSYSPVPI